ncbi:MAG: response regulator [Anaerolineae bacterium]|nr:MAG: response regulator [Anaerolineae bacterium]
MISRPTIPTPSKKILLVEDNELIREGIKQHLQIDNFLVMTAGDGIEALETLEHFTPDLILADINMPRMDGITFYKELRKSPRWTAIPFIFLTADNSPESIRRGRELGVEDYITKPVNHRDLVNTINARLLRAAEIEVAHIGQAYLETVKVLANAIEGRDRYTRGHVDRVTQYTLWTAQALHWSEHDLRRLEFGARLHDIGKIIIPDRILNKKEKLTPEEWELMRRHPKAGAEMLQNITHLADIRPLVLYHHERWDGKGYPEGLGERDIPLGARILAIADVYDALTTERPYHPARPPKDVLEFLRFNAGKAFDPDLVPIFCQVIERTLKR